MRVFGGMWVTLLVVMSSLSDVCVQGQLCFGASGPQRENITSVWEMLNQDCDACVEDADSIYCKSGKGTVTSIHSVLPNETFTNDMAANGFCWKGTWGKMQDASGSFPEIYCSKDVEVDLQCEFGDLFYQQCALSLLVAAILVGVGGLCCISCSTVVCAVCGWCRCCNRPGDDSNWGCCKRFCCCCCGRDKSGAHSAKGGKMMDNPMRGASQSSRPATSLF